MDSVYSFNMNTNFALPKVAHSSMMGNTSALDGSGRSTATQVNQCQTTSRGIHVWMATPTGPHKTKLPSEMRPNVLVTPSRHSCREKHKQSSAGLRKPIFSAIVRTTSCRQSTNHDTISLHTTAKPTNHPETCPRTRQTTRKPLQNGLVTWTVEEGSINSVFMELSNR
jgi:hypothetical protein